MERIRRLQAALPALHLGRLPEPRPKTSSVLIVLGVNETTQREEILLTKRTMWVESHKGQVSFPGGFWESGDATLVDTALRESSEEIGTKPDHVRILGGLSPVETHQGVAIYPWVGQMAFPYPFRINPAEVERILFLPLDALLTEGLKPVTVQVGQVHVRSQGIFAEDELVWGATARILQELLELLR